MARYTGASFKKSRQLGFSTLGNGKELARRPYAPGAHGKDRKRKLSEYGIQLEEKQKAISNVLFTADREINLLEKKIEQKKKKKKAMMQLLLTGIVRVNQKGGE